MFTFSHSRHKLLSIAGLLAATLVSLPAGAATANTSLGFTFSEGVATDLVNPGNRFVFQDNSELGISLTATAWVGADWGAISSGIAVAADADYEQYGYSVANGVSGLGVCSGGQLNGCVGSADDFGLNAQNKAGMEWLLLTSDNLMQFDSLLFEPTSSKKGSLVMYSGTIDLFNMQAGLNAINFDNPITFDYARNSGNQLIDLTGSSSGNALLIGAQGPKSAFTVQRVNTTVVPIPSAIWLMGSAMLIVAVRARRRLS